MLMRKVLITSEPSFAELSSNYVNGVYSFSDYFTILNVDILRALYLPHFEFYALYSSASLNMSHLVSINEITNTELLGWLVYTYTFFIFLVISLILLIAMIGSIILVLNQNINVKRQLIFRQTLRNLKSSVSLKN
jgi:hypothetical protein